MALFDLFGQLPIASVDDLRKRRMMPSENIGEVGPSAPPMPERSPIENVGEVGPMLRDSPIGEVGPSGLPSPLMLPRPATTAAQRVNVEGKGAALPRKPAPFAQDRLPLDGEVLPPDRSGGARQPTVATPASSYELPMTKDRMLKRGLAMALIGSGTAGQRVQGLQLLAETNRPTAEEAAVIERNRLLGIVKGADVEDDVKRRAELGVNIGATPKDLLEVLGFDATGQKAKEAKKDNLIKQVMTQAAAAVPTGVIERSANRVNQLIDLHPPGFFNTVTGPLGMAFQYAPHTAARQLGNEINTIKSIIGFDRLQEMREQSKTGGALGQVSNIELMFLQSVQGSLDQWQKPQLLKDNIRDLISSRKILNQMHALVPMLDQGNPEAINQFGELVGQLNQHGNDMATRELKVTNIAPRTGKYRKFEEKY